MNVRDWRDVRAELLAPIYAQAHRRWLHELGWDSSSIWHTLEQARTTWGLPGLVAVDDTGRILGWTFYLRQDDRLQVGGLTAGTPDVTRALVRALLGEFKTSSAREIACFMFDDAPALADELVRAGFVTETFLYLTREITGQAGAFEGRADAWTPDDLRATAALLRDAYGREAGRHFAPGHTPAAWERYVAGLVEQTALGRFNPHATRIVRNGDRVDAVVLVTTLSPETAHLAQVAVHPGRRGGGVAAALIDEACAIAARQGHARATLLVGSSNTTACALYERAGFAARGRFLACHRTIEEANPAVAVDAGVSSRRESPAGGRVAEISRVC